MKAHTELQRKVEALAQTLPAMTDAQREEARLVEGELFVISKAGRVWCSGCNTEFEDASLRETKRKTAVCPNCGRRHELHKSTRKCVSHTKYYFTTTNVCGGFQVIRHFFCSKDVQRRYERADLGVIREQMSWFDAAEVAQLWLTPDGKNTVINARTAQSCMYYNDVWNFSSPLSIKTRNHERYHYGGYISKHAQLLPQVKRNGVKNFKEPIAAYELVKAVLSDPFAESLIKHGQHSLLHTYVCTYRAEHVKHFSKSIAVAMRHRYIVRDASLYLDYLKDLEELNLDLRNPKYICPDNLRKAHAETQRRIDVIEARKERLEEERKMLEEAEAVRHYADRMLAFAGIVLEDDEIRVTAIPTVEDVRDEGAAMHHCVFANEYYKQDNSLLMTARIDDKRVETIEFSLRDGVVLQSRGIKNTSTKYHKRIVGLVERNSKRLLDLNEVNRKKFA